MRFKLHFVPGQHPVLAFCSATGGIYFWDFKRLTAYRDIVENLTDPKRDKSKQVRVPNWLRLSAGRPKSDKTGVRNTQGGDRDSLSSFALGSDTAKPKDEFKEYSPETLEAWASRYSTEDPHVPLKPHKTESASATYVGRQMAWSPGGEWCVVVGSSNVAIIMQRWQKKSMLTSGRAAI
jgi:polycomb protein EED